MILRFESYLPQVSFLVIFRATVLPHNFLAATFLLFKKNLFEVKRKTKLDCPESLMFAVELLIGTLLEQ